jgi:hypothetical protein
MKLVSSYSGMSRRTYPDDGSKRFVQNADNSLPKYAGRACSPVRTSAIVITVSEHPLSCLPLSDAETSCEHTWRRCEVKSPAYIDVVVVTGRRLVAPATSLRHQHKHTSSKHELCI